MQDNTTIFVVVLITIIFFLIFLIWAQIEDRKDHLRVSYCTVYYFSVYTVSKNV
jgi:hypothetical protein